MLRNKKNNSHILTDLPASRIIPCRTFTKVGMDFAGQILCENKKGYRVKTHKILCVDFHLYVYKGYLFGIRE